MIGNKSELAYRTALGEFSEADWKRLESKIDMRSPVECWMWTGGRFTDGYGAFAYRRATLRAHRLVLVLNTGELGETALHSCDTPTCVNPKHLRWGNPADNMTDKVKRGRQARGERIGKGKLTETDVVKCFELRALGWSQVRIGAELGVVHSAVGRILSGKTWRHVTRPAELTDGPGPVELSPSEHNGQQHNENGE